ncbi:hypothetical protein FOCC_FOCC000378 [Frankliniella occidentalis]|nr:hypothetical protein FOCC_FOCC000378 [Frankliniella occidentalis]
MKMANEVNSPAANVTRANEEDSTTNRLVPAANAHFGSQQGNSQRTSGIHRNDWEMLSLDVSMRQVNVSGEGPSQSSLYCQSVKTHVSTWKQNYFICVHCLQDAANDFGVKFPPNYNWQATKTSVKERFSFMFNNEILADVHFIVGRGEAQERIPAHKFVLSVGSAVFDAMFNGTLATKGDEIDLPDIEPAAFLSLLRFLYSDEVQIGPETVMTTLYTAKKYVVPALEKACVDFLERNLCSENAFLLLTQARLFDEPQLANLCLDNIDKNTNEAFSADGFPDVDLSTLTAVLERDTLRIKESKLFQAIQRWAEAECLRRHIPVTGENQRAALGSALSLVRFPLMTVEEFASGPAQSGILTDRETVQLFLYFTVNPKPSVGFLDVPRSCMSGKELTVTRFAQVESRWGYSGASDRIRFMTDRRIFIAGFGLYGSIHGPAEYDVSLQLIQNTSNCVLGSNHTTFSCDGTNYTFRVMFKNAIEIQPNVSYTASATIKGPDSHYGTKGQRKVTVDCHGDGKVTFQFQYAAGNNNGTSVEDGQIPEIIFYT